MSTKIVSDLNGLERAPHPPHDPGYGVFTTADGDHITLSIAGEDHQWRALCEVLGLVDEAELDTRSREARSLELIAVLREEVGSRRAAWLTDRLDAHGVPFGPVNDTASLADDPHVIARELITGTEQQLEGHRYVRQPIRFGTTQSPTYSPAPELGEHTREILAEVGIDTDALAASGVVAPPANEGVSP